MGGAQEPPVAIVTARYESSPKRSKEKKIWLERDILPADFRKNCPNCLVIIDCFEIFIDRPSDLLARSQTYSNYKNHNTLKYLIGITPQGSVSYISDAWKSE